jgi:uncharacterized protein
MKNDAVPHLSDIPEGILLKIHVQPRASRTEISGWTDEGLKIRLTSPPVDGAANRLCAEFIAKTLGVAKSSITIESGDKSRRKLVKVRGISAASAAGIIAATIEGT